MHIHAWLVRLVNRIVICQHVKCRYIQNLKLSGQLGTPGYILKIGPQKKLAKFLLRLSIAQLKCVFFPVWAYTHISSNRYIRIHFQSRKMIQPSTTSNTLITEVARGFQARTLLPICLINRRLRWNKNNKHKSNKVKVIFANCDILIRIEVILIWLFTKPASFQLKYHN